MWDQVIRIMSMYVILLIFLGVMSSTEASEINETSTKTAYTSTVSTASFVKSLNVTLENPTNTTKKMYIKQAPMGPYAWIIPKINTWKYAALIPFALTANILILIVLSKQINSVSSYTYMAAIAVVDPVMLIFKATHTTMHTLNTVFSDAGCKIMAWIVDSLPILSTMLVITMTIERFIAVWFPFKAQQLCTVVRARVIVLITALCSGLFLILHLLSRKSYWRGSRLGWGCIAEPVYEIAYYYWNYSYIAVYCIIPLLILFTVNTLIIHKLRTAMASRSSMNQSSSADERSRAITRQVTRMAVACSVTYAMCILPFSAYYIWLWSVDAADLAKIRPVQNLFYTIAQLCHDFNAIVNIFLYTMSGRTFREELMKLICPCRKAKADDHIKSALTAESSLASTSKM